MEDESPDTMKEDELRDLQKNLSKMETRYEHEKQAGIEDIKLNLTKALSSELES